MPPNIRFLSKWTTVERVAKAGSPAVGCVISSTLSFTLAGFLAVPFLEGLTEAFIVVVGVTAWAMPTAQSAVTAATAMRVNLRMDLLGSEGCAANYCHYPPRGRSKVSVGG